MGGMTRQAQREAGEAHRDAKKKRLKLHNPTHEIPKANYAVAVLNAMDGLRSVMIHRHNPERIQQIAKDTLEKIGDFIK
jgi:hypothetical protein